MMRSRTTQPVPLPAARSHGALLQRACACGESEARRKKRPDTLQRLASGPAAASVAPPIVHEVLRGTGQPLDPATRGQMEPRFGHDFGRVRVHADGPAAESARAVNAHAYTVGSDIVFAAGRYAPQTDSGRRLLAHELTHVIQQAGAVAPAPGSLTIGEPHSAEERTAERLAQGSFTPAGGIATGIGSLVQRQSADFEPAFGPGSGSGPAPQLSQMFAPAFGPESGSGSAASPAAAPVEPGKAPGTEFVFT